MSMTTDPFAMGPFRPSETAATERRQSAPSCETPSALCTAATTTASLAAMAWSQVSSISSSAGSGGVAPTRQAEATIRRIPTAHLVVAAFKGYAFPQETDVLGIESILHTSGLDAPRERATPAAVHDVRQIGHLVVSAAIAIERRRDRIGPDRDLVVGTYAAHEPEGVADLVR